MTWAVPLRAKSSVVSWSSVSIGVTMASTTRRINDRVAAFLGGRLAAFAISSMGAGPPVTDLVERWRSGFWGELAVRRASREPARRLLPEEERDWRPATWRHFRFVLTRHLQKEGAHTLHELAQDPPSVLGLKLNRHELKAVVDSARRRGEIAELSRAGGVSYQRAEWIITEHGRKEASHALPWLFAQGTRMQSWVVPTITALGVFGIGVSKTQGPNLILLVVASVLVGSMVWLLASIRSTTSGAKAGRRVGRDWARWGRLRPAWYRKAFQPFPWRSALLGAVTFVAGSALDRSAVSYALAAVTCVCFIRLVTWKERWDFN